MGNQFLEFLDKLGMTTGNTAICEAVKAGYMACFDSATDILYHFINSNRLIQVLDSNCFTPNNSEHEYIGDGNRFMSFSRTKSLREGYGALFSSYDGYSDDWAQIRLTIDGDRFNQHPNYHTGDGLQHSTKFRPFEWETHELRANGSITPGIESGKEYDLASDDDITLNLNIENNTRPASEAHPFAQAEDRLITTGEYIPGADRFIRRIDILLLPDTNDDYLDELPTH